MKNKLRIVLTCLSAIAVIIALLFAFKFFFTGKHVGKSKFLSTYYAGSEVQGVISICDNDGNYLKKGKVHAVVVDRDGKKVKSSKTSIKYEDSHLIPVTVPLDENLEPGSYTLRLSYWDGIVKEEGDIDFRIESSKSIKTVISLDKGIYKPGDTVRYRALLLSNRTTEPISGDVTVEIFDGNDNKVYSETTKASDYGIVSGKFDLASEVNSGDYRLVVKRGTYTETQVFKVNPYVEPKFEISVTPDKDFYKFGDTASIGIDAKYFFGEPVKGATVTLVAEDFELEKKVLTDDNGHANVTFNVADINKKSEPIKVTCIDSSNYSIEKTTSISMGQGVKTLEVFSDYGEGVVLSGYNNKVYFILKDERDNPIKTYGSLTVGDRIKRDFVTDDAGMGSITLSASDISSLSNYFNLKLTFKENDVETVMTAAMTAKPINGVMLNTDKIKYKEGEKISVTLNYDEYKKDKFLYVTKNNEIYQIIPITSNTVDVELDEGISGLISLFVSDMNYVSRVQRYSKVEQLKDYQAIDSNKKTIFVENAKGLDIGITTDKEEYMPGEKINIGFEVSAKDSVSDDAALLVSILDEAILSLADNDLNINNIMLDLSDIELTDGMTLADLYALILNEEDETQLNALLLRQSGNASSILDGSQAYLFTREEDTYELFLKLVVSCIVACALIISSILLGVDRKSEKYKTIVENIKAVVSVLVIFAAFSVTLFDFFDEFAYETISTNHSAFIAVLINATLAIVSYLLILYKYKDQIMSAIIDLMVTPAIIAIIVMVGIEFDAVGIMFIALLVLLVVYSIAVALARKGNEKIKNAINRASVIFGRITSAIVKAFIFFLVLGICDFSIVGLIIGFVLYLLYPKIFGKKEKMNIQDGKVVLNINKGDVVGFSAGVILIIVLFVFLAILSYIYNSAQSTINDSMTSMSAMEDYDTIGSTYSSRLDSMTTSSGKSVSKNASDSSYASSASSGQSLLDRMEEQTKDFITKGSKGVSDYNYEDMINSEDVIYEENSSDNNQEPAETTTRIRNIFVESLAFIPELLVEDGKASYNMDLSDNITTWNIQVVGNSKEGELGYASKQFKVFKDFFTDVSLPTNAVEGDKISVPITVYNYTDTPMTVKINVPANDWSTIGTYQTEVNVEAKNTKMIYLPLDNIKQGDHVLKVEAVGNNGKPDAVEKAIRVNYKGLEKTEVSANGISSGTNDISVVFDKTSVISGSERIKVKIYPTVISLVLNNVDSMIKLPTGCFEQTSSSLYPDILILKYLESNNMDTPELREKLNSYISKGYQKLLTYEVKGEPGGFSLYGNKPAETVITSFGLMEFNELKDVYEIDEGILNEMEEFIYSKQDYRGRFDYNSTYIGSPSRTDEDAMTAYIAWGLSEYDSEDSRLDKTESYLEKVYKESTDGYTLALIANVFQNTNNKNFNEVVDKIKDLVADVDNNTAYIKSTSRDYYGSYGERQNLQSTALASMALSRNGKDTQLNKKLINYIYSQIDSNGSWYSTQATILGLKALNEAKLSSDKVSKKIVATLNGESKELDLSGNVLDIYELEFTNVNEQNSLSLELGKEEMQYEVVREYYTNYPENKVNEGIDVTSTFAQTTLKVNDRLNQTITVQPQNTISNMIVKVDIPQGCSVDEDSLLNMKYNGYIEKYEYNYGKINVYLRNVSASKTINITYKANFPVNITGGAVEAYDYYNVSTRGYNNPTNIIVTE